MQKVGRRFIDDLSLPDLPEEFQKTLEDFSEMYMLYDCAIREVNTKLENLNEELKFKKDRNPIQYINHRLKSPQSILKKLQMNHLDVDYETIWNEITDIAGIRVICAYIDDIYAIAEMLIKQDDVTLLKKKDYIKNPKESGYRSLHLIIETPVFLSDKKQLVKVEVQIRTIAMDFWASLEHQLRYKTNVDVPDSIRKQLRNSADSIYQTDQEMQCIYQEISRMKEKGR